MREGDPLFRPIALARPRLDTPSAWTDLLPIGMLLVDLVRPRTLVELGVKNGISYCGFCQTVQALDLDTQCFAVDTWEGDPTTTISNHDATYERLRAYHDPLYSSFSTLLRMTFDEALAHVEDGSVDLLHIDGWHAYEAVRHDFETWLPKLSGRGVALLHDVCVRSDGFGVWRFWEELKGRYPTFRIDHGAGLGIVAVGPQAHAALAPLLDAPPDEQMRFRALMADLGAARRVPGLEAQITRLRARNDELRRTKQPKPQTNSDSCLARARAAVHRALARA